MLKVLGTTVVGAVLVLGSAGASAHGWNDYHGYHHGWRGPSVGAVIGTAVVGGLVAGAVDAAVAPPVVVQQPYPYAGYGAYPAYSYAQPAPVVVAPAYGYAPYGYAPRVVVAPRW
ncbi:MAG TPA: hypothetical protein VME63_02415 [Dyella sp.]|uniref:hypothetical protein n=1 Tax=Dyella sp. TaxID=1869338 RepID=UPI002C775BA5|nr:hypothetical protein [Dyella sp.]HTV84228.1 hypothetical protein [Dyella sp.]